MAQGHDDHAEREVHRPLQLQTPNRRGPDVRALQDAINELFKKWKLANRVAEDGEFGRHTKLRANRVGWLLGLDPSGGSELGPVFTEKEQRAIRNPDQRTKEQKERGARRVAEAQAAQEAHEAGAELAVKWAVAQVGTTESPPYSNRGPKIDEWVRYCGLTPPVYWCGCFAGTAVVREGKAKCYPSGLVHNVILANLAWSGLNGLHDVSLTEARKGDLVTFTFGHIGLVREDYNGGALRTVEGNTDGAGTANGGGVFAKERTTSIQCIARPAYP